MSNVVRFPHPERKPSRTPLAPGHSATIILFLGVRYERHAEPQAGAPVPSPHDGRLSGRDNGGRRKTRRRA